MTSLNKIAIKQNRELSSQKPLSVKSALEKKKYVFKKIISCELPETMISSFSPQKKYQRETPNFLFRSQNLQLKSQFPMRARSRTGVRPLSNAIEKQLRETDDSVKKSRLRRKNLSIKDFMLVKQMGRGRHGRVYIAIHRLTGFMGALKIFEKESYTRGEGMKQSWIISQLINQLKIQSFCNHPNIIKIFTYFSDQQFIYFFMELGSDGQLFDLLSIHKTFKEETISFICRGLLQALEYLHQNNIIHRDIKPQNIVLVHGVPKICDFGQSSVCIKEKGELRKTLCGTPLYLSPQILMGHEYDQKIDIWALGALGYELYTGTNPFDVKNREELKKVITEEFVMRKGSIQICNFMTYCLKKKSAERPTAKKLLKHPFITRWGELQTAEQLCN